MTMLNYLMLYNSFYLIFLVLVKLLIIDCEIHYFTFSIFCVFYYSSLISLVSTSRKVLVNISSVVEFLHFYFYYFLI